METLDTGLRLLNESLAELKAQGRKEIPGELIFKLYDTFGFPVDIVQDVVRDTGMGGCERLRNPHGCPASAAAPG
jgi:alanyl-tRNA synthetase